MWNLLPWSRGAASGYPQRECFFCRTTSIILPPYNQQDGRQDDLDGHMSNQNQHGVTVSSASTSTISTGTPTNWFCSSCHCQNVADQDGTPVEQYSRPMWDEAWNRDRSQLMRHTRPHSSNPSKRGVATSLTDRANVSQTGTAGQAPFKFCHTCQTNQVLTLNMLADYLPTEDDPEYQQKLQSLAEYEASIASRYPPVCSDCAPSVQQRITERDQFARSWSLGKWLDLKKKTSLTGLVDSADGLSSSPAVKTEQTAQVANTASTHALDGIFRLENGSTLAKASFALVNASIWAAYLTTALRGRDVVSAAKQLAEGIKREPISLEVVALAFFSVLMPTLIIKSGKMDPLQRSIQRARARQVRVEVRGLNLWRNTQTIIVALRLVVLFSAISVAFMPSMVVEAVERMKSTTGKGGIEMLRIAAVSVLISEVGMTALAATQLRVRPPAPLHLVSRPIDANGRHSGMIDPSNDALLTTLSLNDQASGAGDQLAFDRRQGEVGGAFHPHAEQCGAAAPRVERDADGDAVMEDAAAYVARRASHSSDDDDDEQSVRVSAPSASTWSSNWSLNETSKQPGFASTSTPDASNSSQTARSSRYNDFQLGPQRFWEPQNPTGLEDVFGRAVSLDDGPQRNDEEGARRWSRWLGFS